MPFSNKTKRQRCEKGQTVPEYKTIMSVAPEKQKHEWAIAGPLNEPA
jgi:hypothetical protein